jgi:glycosyltransferase involved in cell wall biosynthesis
MVGTIEPRKGYGAVLDAFDALWRDDCDHRLIIVGREGWTHLPDQWRASIIAVRDRLEHHPERFRKLVWMSGADDDQLALAYRQADCLIAASYGEGFGLPIIESYQRGVPVLARDIAVFREVAPAGTVFFRPNNLAQSIAQWQPPVATSQAMSSGNNTNSPINITWQDSARLVMDWLGQPIEPEQSLPVLSASHTDTDLSQHG